MASTMTKPKVVTLFNTETFRPIGSHRELEPILNRLGFVADRLPRCSDEVVTWKAYSFNGNSSSDVNRPRLPYPRIDMLHVKTYQVFIDTLGQYIGHEQVQNHLHIRGLPPPWEFDKDEMQMEVWYNEGMVPAEQIFAFRKGSLDETTKLLASNLNLEKHDIVRTIL